MSASKIKVETHAVTQAGVDMGDAANTTHEVLGLVASASQPAAVSDVFGEPHLNAVFNDFWTKLHQQVQLSGDVFAELGKLLGRGAVKLDKGDIVNANTMNSVSAPVGPAPGTPAPATTPSAAPPGADNNPPPVTSAPPPPGPTTPTDPAGGGGDANSPGGGGQNAPGSATGV